MKHDHKKTKKLKSSIFIFIALLPMIYFVINALVYVFNKSSIDLATISTPNEPYLEYVLTNLENSMLFSFCTASPFHQPIKNFISIFGFSADKLLHYYLIYISTMTCIYVVFDIIVEIFIKLTHLFDRE